LPEKKNLENIHIQALLTGKVNEEAVSKLFSKIGKLPAIEQLSLSLSTNPPFNRTMTLNEVEALSEMLKTVSKLKNLVLNFTPYFSPSVQEFSRVLESFSGHEHLRKLFLTIQGANNLKMYDKCFSALGECLSAQKNLEDLSLHLFNLKYAERIFLRHYYSSLEELKHLKNLSLIFDYSLTQYYPTFVDDELSLLAQSLRKTPVEVLFLVFNSLDQESETLLPSFFMELGSIETLDKLAVEEKSYNLFHPEIYTSLFEGISQLPKLRVFRAELWDCSWEHEMRLSPEEFTNIEESLSKLKSLIDLQLFLNRTCEDLLVAVGKGIEGLNDLCSVSLDISGFSIRDPAFFLLTRSLSRISTLKNLILGLKRCSMLSDIAVCQLGRLLAGWN